VEFGLERLAAVLAANGRRGARDVCDAVSAALNEFRGEASAHDDVTLVALKATDAGGQATKRFS
jgi:serine phosphatase RsbU (regulator of sigma subunit)